MAATGWKRRFDDPIPLPDGKKLVTLRDAIAVRKRGSKTEHGLKQVQAAAHCVTEAAENGGPMMFARMGMMQAINRYHQHRTELRRKATKKYRLVRRRT
jgi:hypothetical protein